MTHLSLIRLMLGCGNPSHSTHPRWIRNIFTTQKELMLKQELTEAKIRIVCGLSFETFAENNRRFKHYWLAMQIS